MQPTGKPVGRIETLPLFPEERAALIDLLSSLKPDEWGLPTVCAGWSVKDIAAHIIADDLGRLSRERDQHRVSWIQTDSWEELVAAINRANELWVEAMRRLSGPIIIDLLRLSGDQSFDHFSTMDLDAIGSPVDWVSPEPAPVWLDVAREYTERWAHQQQIRDALDRPGLKDRRMFHPVLDAYARALPLTYRDVDAADGTHVQLRITGDAGGTWSLVRADGAWGLYTDVETEADASIAFDQEEAWRLFTKATAPDTVRAWATVSGDASLALRVLETVSVIA